MSQINTELTAALLNNESLDELFRSHLEVAVNDLLKNELTAFLGYEKHSTDSYNTGNSSQLVVEHSWSPSWSIYRTIAA